MKIIFKANTNRYFLYENDNNSISTENYDVRKFLKQKDVFLLTYIDKVSNLEEKNSWHWASKFSLSKKLYMYVKKISFPDLVSFFNVNLKNIENLEFFSYRYKFQFWKSKSLEKFSKKMTRYPMISLFYRCLVIL